MFSFIKDALTAFIARFSKPVVNAAEAERVTDRAPAPGQVSEPDDKPSTTSP